MRCSDCHREVRPVVALDIDGTLGDYHGDIAEFAERYLDRPMAPEVGPYTGATTHREWFCAAFDTDPTMFRAIKLAYRQGGLKRLMPIFDGARRLVIGLRPLAEVWLTTTRPHDRFDRVDPDTREWLRRHDLPYDGLLYSDDKMEELAVRVDRERVAYVLDDQVDQLYMANETFGPDVTVLRRNDYNLDALGWNASVGDLGQALDLACAYINDWRLTHV